MSARRRRKPTPGDPLLAVGYIRVSTEDQALSPEAQRDAIERWCEREGIRLVAVHVDRLTSVTPIERRTGLPAALADLVAFGAGVVVVARRDRIARDPILTAMVERIARDAGASVRSAGGEGTENDDPTSVLMRRIIDAFAEYERLVIKMRTTAALAVKKRRGERVGSVPYGWRLSAGGVVLEEDPAEHELVAVARELRGQGLPLREVAAQMAARGLVGRAGKALQPMQVARMVSQ